ncbi:hypothetical protein ELI02_30135 (plasmid) [Rhizobium leguminosarum]|uniref:hypothetical protein n=1 Tax=Rhizobium leguminosarum TaxID=384 RepID=UPI00102FF881|nr:hypothetical protein [Rhizobium leguminosarum]TAX45970.1 hypothetical protein ELI02_30135 [Rhizobium leguminosarum]
MRDDLSDIQIRLADINHRAAPVLEENSRLHAALGKAITLILTIAAVGLLTVVAVAPTEQKLKSNALDNQEQITWQK